MTTIALPHITAPVESRVTAAVCDGLTARRKHLPSWLFYDNAGSDLFDQITRLPEYYVTATERRILAKYAAEIIANSAEMGSNSPLRVVELGAGSADKTRLVLKAAVDHQGSVVYEPIDVSSSALEAARDRIEREIPQVSVCPCVSDYTQNFALQPVSPEERRLVLYIGSSIGNFEPAQAHRLLEGLRAALDPGDTILLGVDLRKDIPTLLSAYDDAAGVTARFNLNLLTRINREFDADFNIDAFAHRAVWNDLESRMEMHLESRIAQTVRLATVDLEVAFRKGERIHTENSYKYAPGQVEQMLSQAGFVPESTWTDERKWFAVCLARVQ